MKFSILLCLSCCIYQSSCNTRRIRLRRQAAAQPFSLLTKIQKIRIDSEEVANRPRVDPAVKSIFSRAVIVMTQIENMLKRNPELQFVGLSKINGANLVIKRVQQLQENAKVRIARASAANQDVSAALTALQMIQRIEEVLIWEPPENLGSHKKLLPLSCGLSVTLRNRIRGGIYSEPGALPWMAQLRSKTSRSNLPFCGGALITQNVVLTAAHCFVFEEEVTRADEVSVRLGQYDTRDNSGQNFDVLKILPHPRYSPKRRKNDIALLYLKGQVSKFDDLIRPICMPDTLALRQNDFNSRPVQVAGWGIEDPEKRSRSGRLMELKLEVVPSDVCNFNYTSRQRQEIDQTMICAGDPDQGTKDSCQGDSGGPLMLQNGAKYCVIGIVSFGQALCGNEPFPGVYARVTTFMDWILSNL